MHTDEAANDTTDVVRFPVERRNTVEMLRQLAPDPCAVSLLAETYDLALPLDLEARVDQEAAEFILNQVPATGPERTDMLREMLAGALSTAFAAVRGAERLAQAASAAREQLAAGATMGLGFALQDIERHAAERSLEAAEALVVAHGRALEVFGIARAIELARRGEPWTPRQVNADMEWMVQVEEARRAR